MSMFDQFLFPDNYSDDKKYMKSKGYGSPTPGGLYSSWLSDARESDRQSALQGSVASLGQMMKFIMMMRGSIGKANGGTPAFAPPSNQTALKNAFGSPLQERMSPLDLALLQLQTSPYAGPRGPR